MKLAKRGNISTDTISKYILVIILVVILFQILAALFPTAVTAGTALNTSGFPLASLFVSGGAGWYILAAGVIILLVNSFLKSTKGR